MDWKIQVSEVYMMFIGLLINEVINAPSGTCVNLSANWIHKTTNYELLLKVKKMNVYL